MSSPTSDKVVDESSKPGHINNLSDEQEEKLKGIWKKFFSLVGDASDGSPADLAASGGAHSKAQHLPSRGGEDNTGVTPKEARDGGADKDKNKGQASAEEEARGANKLVQEEGGDGLHDGFWQFAAPEDPDALMLRFLRARGWDVEQAFSMLASTIKWRKDTRVAEDIIAPGEEGLCKLPGVKKNLESNKCYFHGTDRQGCPVIYARAKTHKASTQTNEEMLKYIVYQMETSRTLIPSGEGIETTSVFLDMSGLGMSSMDWDTATMVPKIFQNNYPELLNKAVIWNAPTLFSGVWKVIKPMLDPAVQEKIRFASSTKDIEDMIDPKHLEKDLGGTSTWRYVFKEAVEGENKHMEDAETKEKRIADYKAAYTAFEASTKKWISGDDEAKKTRRAKDAKILEIRRLDMDPYIRGQTVFTRDGTVVGDGQIKWHYDHGRSEEFGKSTNENASELGIEDPPSRPQNKDSAEIVLSSDEDTGSDTANSEDDILDDPHHHHHNSVAVGFAKVGDNIANTFSKLGPGKSIKEKRRARREETHARHEERRARKLEKKKQRIEAEQRHQEEMRQQEEDQNATEQDVANSYAAYLTRLAHLPIDAAAATVNAASNLATGATASRAPADDEKVAEKSPAQVQQEADASRLHPTSKGPPEVVAKHPASRGGAAAAPYKKAGLAEYFPGILAIALGLLAVYLGGKYARNGTNAGAQVSSAISSATSAAATKASSVSGAVHAHGTVSGTTTSTVAVSAATASAVVHETPIVKYTVTVTAPSSSSSPGQSRAPHSHPGDTGAAALAGTNEAQPSPATEFGKPVVRARAPAAEAQQKLKPVVVGGSGAGHGHGHGHGAASRGYAKDASSSLSGAAAARSAGVAA